MAQLIYELFMPFGGLQYLTQPVTHRKVVGLKLPIIVLLLPLSGFRFQTRSTRMVLLEDIGDPLHILLRHRLMWRGSGQTVRSRADRF